MTDNPGRRLARRVAAVGAVMVLIGAAGCSDDDERAATASSIAATSTPPAASPPSEPLAAPETSEASTTVSPSTPTSTETTTTITGYDFSAVDPIVELFVKQRGLNGAGLIVVDRDDGIIDEEYWGVFGPDRISLIASST
jgi:hypothetical protein